jgi:hypothetical protein
MLLPKDVFDRLRSMAKPPLPIGRKRHTYRGYPQVHPPKERPLLSTTWAERQPQIGQVSGRDLEAERTEQAQVSARAFLEAVASLTRNWGKRFGQANYFVFLQSVHEATIRLMDETKG